MAIFASTTTSGYSDPLKAFSIKALEQRQKDMQAQIAAQQPDTATMGTIPGGIGHVLGVVGDQLQQRRSDQEVAAGRQELAQAMTGYDANKGMTPEQKGILARRAPDVLEKLLQHEQETRSLNTTQTGLNTRNTADIEGRKDVANIQETGASARNAATNATNTGITSMTLGSKESEGAKDRAASSEQLESKQEHDDRMARLNAELAATQKDRDNAFTSGQTDKVQAHDEKLTRLKSELASGEARQSEKFQASQLNQKLASDETMQRLQREAVTANLKLQIAANSGDKAAQQAADKDLARVTGAIQQQRDLITQGHQAQQQALQIKSTEKISADELGMKKAALEQKRIDDAADPATLQKKADAEKKLASETSLVAELDEAQKAFKQGIFTGPEAGFEAGKANLPFVGSYLGDREKAARTTQVNNAMEKVAAGAMSTMLKGATTDFELQKFIKLWNDPKVPYQAKVDQFQRVTENLRADRASQAEAVKKMGGTDRSGAIGNQPAAAAPAAAAGPARPEGKDDGALISEARAAITAGKNPEAVKKQLDAWGVKGAL